MSARVVPWRRVLDLLAEFATDRGLQVSRFTAGVRIMCAQCYPAPQPERLQYPGGVGWFGRTDDPWDVVLANECKGFVTILYPNMGAHAPSLLPEGDAVDALSVRSCCHDEDNALGGWFWREDLEAAIAHELDSADYSEEWDRLTAAHEAAAARDAAVQAVYEAAEALTPKERVQAVGAVLKAAGKPVTIDQARVSWDCGHVTEAGDFGRLIVVVDGMPKRGYESCTLHDDDDVLPDLNALGEEFRRVAAMPLEERAKYKPVAEAKRSRGGPPWARGGSGKPKAAPKPTATPEWFTSHGIDPSLPVQKLFALAKEADPKAHPPRASIEAMKRAARPR